VDALELRGPQRDAATAADNYGLVVNAGPGTGKTRVLVARAARFVESVPPDEGIILATTYMRRARAEMAGRLAPFIVGQEERVWVKTMHATGMALLTWKLDLARRYLGFRRLAVATSWQHEQAAITAARRHNLDVNPRLLARDIDLAIAGARPRYTGLPLDVIAEARRDHDQVLHDDGLITPSHMISLPVAAMLDHRDAWLEARGLFARILGDEAQDNSYEESRFLALLGGERGEKLSLFGDVRQAINEFRGSDPRNMQEFARKLPGVQVVVLDETHRMSDPFAAFSNHYSERILGSAHVPSFSRTAGEKPLLATDFSTAREEAGYVAGEVGRLLTTGRVARASDIAVIYRDRSNHGALRDALHALSVRTTDQRELALGSEPAVARALPWLLLLTDDANEHALGRVTGLAQQMAAAGGRWSMRRLARELPPAVGRHQLSDLYTVIAHYKALVGTDDPTDPGGFFDRVVARVGADGRPRAAMDAARGRDSLARLRAIYVAAGGDAGLVEHLVGEEEVKGSGGVLLSTIHGVKGNEFDAVFVTGLTDGFLPNRHALREDPAGGDLAELRVLYVAVTRARRIMYLTGSRERLPYGWGGRPSRYLAAVPAHLVRRVA